MARLIRGYMRLLETHPWKTMSFTSGTLQFTGDAIAQTAIEKTPLRQMDCHRSARFFIIGSVVVAPVLRCWYLIIERVVSRYGFSRLVPLQKVVLDQTIYAPTFIAFFISTMTYWKTGSVQDTTQKMKRDYTTVLWNNYKWWPAVQTLNFYLVPLQYRVLFSNSAAVVWNTYLSYKTNQEVESLEITSPKL